MRLRIGNSQSVPTGINWERIVLAQTLKSHLPRQDAQLDKLIILTIFVKQSTYLSTLPDRCPSSGKAKPRRCQADYLPRLSPQFLLHAKVTLGYKRSGMRSFGPAA
jgi:hypothetical protein